MINMIPSDIISTCNEMAGSIKHNAFQILSTY